MPYEHVLLLLKGYLGDAVMLTPLLKGLSDTGANIEAYTDPGVVSLLRGTFPRVKYHLSRDIKNPLEMLRERREIRGKAFDLAIVVNRSFRSALLAAAAGIPVRVGHDTDRRGFLLTHRVPYYPDRAEPDSCLDLAEAVDLHVPHSFPRLEVPEGDRERMRGRLLGATVGVQPGARHPYKQVPVRTMAEVCESLHQEGHRLAFLGGPDERASAEALSARLSFEPLDLVGDLSLNESMAAAALLSLVIGGDSGFMHIAAAVGAPTVAAFGETNASKWGHHYPPHKVMVSASGKIEDIPAEDILRAAREVLAKK